MPLIKGWPRRIQINPEGGGEEKPDAKLTGLEGRNSKTPETL